MKIVRFFVIAGFLLAVLAPSAFATSDPVPSPSPSPSPTSTPDPNPTPTPKPTPTPTPPPTENPISQVTPCPDGCLAELDAWWDIPNDLAAIYLGYSQCFGGRSIEGQFRYMRDNLDAERWGDKYDTWMEYGIGSTSRWGSETITGSINQVVNCKGDVVGTYGMIYFTKKEVNVNAVCSYDHYCETFTWSASAVFPIEQFGNTIEYTWDALYSTTGAAIGCAFNGVCTLCEWIWQ